MVGGGGGPAEEELGAGRGGEAPRQRADRGQGGRRFGRRWMRGEAGGGEECANVTRLRTKLVLSRLRASQTLNNNQSVATHGQIC